MKSSRKANNNFGLSIQLQDVRFFQNMKINLIVFKISWKRYSQIKGIELM